MSDLPGTAVGGLHGADYGADYGAYYGASRAIAKEKIAFQRMYIRTPQHL
jgi:hypothetical protein